MPEFVIMTKGSEKKLLDADDEKHIALFKELGYRQTGHGVDGNTAHDVEKGIQRPVEIINESLEEKYSRIVKILMG